MAPAPAPQGAPARQVIVAVFDGVELLDVTGPAEVFSVADRLRTPGSPGYVVRLAAVRRGPVRTSSGVRLVADVGFGAPMGAVDTAIVPGGITPQTAGSLPIVEPAVVGWVARRSAAWRRVASVCAGAHMLAAAGLLDGRPATTHWFTAGRLAAEFPAVAVDPDPIFIRSGRIWTCAGVSAGMDLALAMVAEDHGDQLAREVARWMVMYLRRPGGQSQFSAPLAPAAPRTDRIRDAIAWIVEHPGRDLSVPALARHAHLSERHFARLFAREAATTPAAYVETVRVEAVRRALEETDDTLDVVAARCGFTSVETLHRVFRRRLTVIPDDYRRRFRLPSAG
ncbi:transcriptional regulator [Pseudofrankia sp. EUN1h]|nr:transcriptional regulator [Pseudofrankia sp. EUN1h]